MELFSPAWVAVLCALIAAAAPCAAVVMSARATRRKNTDEHQLTSDKLDRLEGYVLSTSELMVTHTQQDADNFAMLTKGQAELRAKLDAQARR